MRLMVSKNVYILCPKMIGGAPCQLPTKGEDNKILEIESHTVMADQIRGVILKKSYEYVADISTLTQTD